ncbi:MAG TPA: aldose 1-epimerase family protein [Actinomycetota bacterium]|jgi:aldose 1-epimerase|nr:aldose 1-epimerase family protein [Actinomycetota bacterium]
MPTTREALLPTGAQHEIAYGDQRAVVTEVGATLRAYEVAGTPVIDGFAADERSSAGRGQVLAPWPNRLEDGRYTYAGMDGSAALDEPERGNAIHGLVRWLPWTLDLRTDEAVVLRCTLHPQPGYPWLLDVAVRYAVGPGGLEVEADATNRSDVPAPFGIGFHPYVTVGTERIDDAHLQVPAGEQLAADERGLPTGRHALIGSDADFISPRPVGATRLDTAFTGLLRDKVGRAIAVLQRPDEGRAVRVWVDDSFRYLMVYTGDTLEPAERRRAAVAIEPMTCPPNALRTGVDLIELEPGATWRGTWGISPER